MTQQLQHSNDFGDTARLTLYRIEQRTLRRLRRSSISYLRKSIGIVFVWFGVLKAVNASPGGELVATTVPFLDPTWFLPALGILEVALGVGLLTGRSPRLALSILICHLMGTFLVLVTQPGLSFQHGNPLLLSTVGESVIKNLVLIAGCTVIASRLHVRV